MKNVSPHPKRPAGAEIFRQGDPNIHYIGLPKSTAYLWRWVVIALLIGAAVALGLVMMMAA